jgi:hypothetical protein
MRTLRTLLVVAGLVLVAARPAVAAPPSTDHLNNAQAAAAWLASQVNADGYIPSAFPPFGPDYSTTAQAVPALVAAGVGGDTVTRVLTYLGAHVDDFASSGGDDKPGALAYLILAAHAGGADPTAFGAPATDLVARLKSTEQQSGLFGVQDATFDGAFRQGLSFLALVAAGDAPDDNAVDWLVGQQCTSGLWMAYRADTQVPCSTPDPSDFTSPDTNSTALAVLALAAVDQSGPAGDGAAALDAVRNSAGGWGLSAAAEQPTDANSTGLVADALLATSGGPDADGLAAIESLQLGCDAAATDRGGIAFQDFGSGLFPDAFATVQAVPALAEQVLPVGPATVTAGVPDVCAAPTTTSTTAPPTSAPATTDDSGGAVVAAEPLARTGSSEMPLALVAVGLMAGGAVLVVVADRRRSATARP